MDFCSMKRKELQSLCKKNGIPANLSNREMATRLATLQETEKQNMFKSCLKNLEIVETFDGENDGVKFKGGKRVRFSPDNDTFEFEKSDPRELRLLTRKRRALLNSRMGKDPVLVVDDMNDVGGLGSGRKQVAVSENICGGEEGIGRSCVALNVDNVVKHEKKETMKRSLRSSGKKIEDENVGEILTALCAVRKVKRGRKGQEGIVETLEKPPDKIATRSLRSRKVSVEKSENVVLPSRRSARRVEKVEARRNGIVLTEGTWIEQNIEAAENQEMKGYSPRKSTMSDETISKEFTNDIHNATESTGQVNLGEVADINTKVKDFEDPRSAPSSVFSRESDLTGVKGNYDRDQYDAKYYVCPAPESQLFSGNEKVTNEIEGLTTCPSEHCCLSSLDGYVGISKVDVVSKENERYVDNLENASIARNVDFAHGLRRAENLQSTPFGIAEVSDVLVDHEMLINCEQVEHNENRGNSKIDQQNVIEEQLISDVQEAAALVVDDHLASERPEGLRSLSCGRDKIQFDLSQVEHGENGSPACVPYVRELQGDESMVVENHVANGNGLDSMPWEIDASPCKLTDFDATLDSLMPDMHGTPGNTVTGVENLSEATSIGETGLHVLCNGPSSPVNGETDYEDVKSNHEAKEEDIACPPMADPQSFGKHDKATNENERALRHGQDIGSPPLVDEAVGTIKYNVAQSKDLGVVDKLEDACLTRSDDLAFESLEDSQNLSCGTANISVLNDNEKMSNSEEVTANEDQEFRGVGLCSSSMKQKPEKFETSISTNSSQEVCITKSEDSISNKSNEKVPENVDVHAVEPACPSAATYMIQEHSKSFCGDGKPFYCSENNHGDEMIGSKTVIGNMWVVSDHENESEVSPCITKGYMSDNAIETNNTAIVDEFVDELIQRGEATGSRDSGENECPTSEHSGSHGLNQFVCDKKCVAGEEANLFLDASTHYADLEGVKGNCVVGQADTKYSVCPSVESQSFGGNEKVTDETEWLTSGPSEHCCLSLFDGYAGISRVDVVLKGNEQDVNNLEDTSIVRSYNFAHGLGRPDNLQSTCCGIAEVSDVLVDNEMSDGNGNQGNRSIDQENVIEDHLTSDVQEAASLVADEHLKSERPEELQSLPCGGDGMQFALSQVVHEEIGSSACVADVEELQRCECMVIEHHDPNSNELGSMAWELDTSPCKLLVVGATVDSVSQNEDLGVVDKPVDASLTRSDGLAFESLKDSQNSSCGTTDVSVLNDDKRMNNSEEVTANEDQESKESRNSDDGTENMNGYDEIRLDEAKVLKSSTTKRKNIRSILIHRTPQKKPVFVHDMKENTVARKTRQMVDVTAVKAATVRRNALEDLQK